MSGVSLLDDAKLSRRVGVRFVSLVVPVTAAILAVVWSVCCLSPIYINSDAAPVWSMVNEADASGVGQRVAYSILSAVIVVVCVVLVTFLVVILYHFHLQIVLYGWLAFSAVSMLFLLLWVWLDLVCTYFQIPYNVLSMGAFVWNFGVVGLITLFYHSHPAVTQVYLVIASVLIAWSMTALPEWTTWSLLICIAAYDIVAVLWEQGPLHRLIKVAQDRNEPIPGFVYDSAHGVAPLSRQSPSQPSAAPATAPATGPPAGATVESGEYVLRHAAPFKLGLGDFIFYSLLVGRASLSGFVPWTFCLVSILAGMVGTLLSLLLFRTSLRALPALPCSIFISIVVFVLCILLVNPLSDFASHRLLVL
ncbi:putative presenilin-like aspartic peptidase [Leptomonas pyrrhocoris]|uniref:Presenilin n=1 Tax=Leptomonas pyrrhocoris TaxID=157538 RepID=A0A0N0VDD7_LEPPY|nr:putative presenilin-like aspartic peptidase [Leptomonas pyrrhocoris]XP_015653464.1 putative presenilin-like aspartic peptidase [Leptomonas pyrrhocoris]KPA75024.1 putative presenilin-like aspartic peptidase [Leptomonas pyrrhocoris]KPA75025.1 putative presenilin-like aspartic peptidase [Leptomonas pyrrhocoris]|eukprot:XP_015653463.1 putative presenilin-like aspartic peptidase [Leptomonas pyrrhocoris]